MQIGLILTILKSFIFSREAAFNIINKTPVCRLEFILTFCEKTPLNAINSAMGIDSIPINTKKYRLALVLRPNLNTT